jgi:hypothetical protein
MLNDIPVGAIPRPRGQCKLRPVIGVILLHLFCLLVSSISLLDLLLTMLAFIS